MAKITTDTEPPVKTLKAGKSKGFGNAVVAIIIVTLIFVLINHFAS